jgi:ubiquinone biosynthesis protein Coq4
MHSVALALTCTLWPLARPWQALRIWRAVRRGYRKGRASEMLLAKKLEERFTEPLESVRSACGLVIAAARRLSV